MPTCDIANSTARCTRSKEKAVRRRLFNTGRCGVGQRFSHVYSRPTQPLQDSQRDRRNERPDHVTEFVCEELRRSRARLRSLLRLTGALDVPASSANLRHARAHHQGAFARRHLVGSPNAKKAPAHDAVIPARTHERRRWTIDDETRRYCVLMVPFALKLFFGLNPESRRFRIYRSRSLLLTPPIQPTGEAGAGAAANAFAFIAWR